MVNKGASCKIPDPPVKYAAAQLHRICVDSQICNANHLLCSSCGLVDYRTKYGFLCFCEAGVSKPLNPLEFLEVHSFTGENRSFFGRSGYFYEVF